MIPQISKTRQCCRIVAILLQHFLKKPLRIGIPLAADSKAPIEKGWQKIDRRSPAEITEIWKRGPEKPAMVSIEVSGTRNLGNFVLFRKTLNDISGVKRIQMKELQADASTMMVDYSGTPKTLADSLMVETFETFSINITEVSEEHLRIELVSH